MKNSQRTPLILGNWKMHGSLANNAALIEGIQSGFTGLTSVNVGVCVPSVYLAQLAQLCQGTTVGWGAQDCSAHTSGAYTGDVSATMLTEFNVKYVLVGHSERRQYQCESSQDVALKAQQALNAGLTPVVCVGETLAQRQADQTLHILTQQLDAVLQVLGAQDLSRCVIAYEPVWAIGTGLTATPEQAQTVHAALRAWLNQHGAIADRMVLLYGGSMKPDNAASLLSQPDIDGGLIGGAALKAADFLAIIHAAQ